MRFPQGWESIDYLAAGNPRQRTAHATLEQAGVMELLAPWRPLLAGTIPLGIDVPGSDLDILCEVFQFAPFRARLQAAFGDRPDFTVRSKEINGLPVVLARFRADPFLVEIFAQPRPVLEQNGYRHMAVEGRLLALAGPGAAAAIRRLKEGGLKTEPAFARYFGLEGDPYQTLLNLCSATDEELRRLIDRR